VLLHPLLVLSLFAAIATEPKPIDRHALVIRHNPVVRRVDAEAPLTIGNGNFAFTAGITGLQGFAAYYQRTGVPTETLSRWCWVTDENPNQYQLADANTDFTPPDGQWVVRAEGLKPLP